MPRNTPAKPGETRGNKSKEPRYPKDENGVRHPTEKQLETQEKWKEISKYDLDTDIGGIISAYAEVWSRANIDTNDPVAVEENIVNYINTCAERRMKPTMEGLATSLGVSRSLVTKWRSGEVKKNKEVLAVIDRYASLLNSLHIQYMMEGKINPVSGIFIGRNNYEGYRDQQEINFNVNNVENTATTNQLADKYKETMAIDITDDVENV